MTTTALGAYQQATALRRAPETVPCRRCHAQRGQNCRTRTGGWTPGIYHQPRHADIAHLDDQQRLDAVAQLDAERENVRQATITALDTTPAANRWTALDQQERRP